jgi:hypothetical protein
MILKKKHVKFLTDLHILTPYREGILKSGLWDAVCTYRWRDVYMDVRLTSA